MNMREYRFWYEAVSDGNNRVLSKRRISHKVIHKRDRSGRTLLHMAVRHRRLDIAKFLIDKGADINTTDRFHRSPLHDVICSRNEAIKDYNLDLVKLLIDRGANVNACNMRGQSALHLAIIYYSERIATLLIDMGANANALNMRGESALHLAIIYDRLDFVSVLIDRGVNVRISTSSGQSPLYLAMSLDRLNIINLLLDEESISVNSAKNGPLHKAIRRGRLDNLMLLTDRGDDICVTSPYAISLIHESAMYNRVDILKFLIDCGVDANAKDVDGLTPLIKGVMHNSLDTVRYLIDISHDAINERDKSGKTLLHVAARSNSRDIVKLLERGCDFSANDMSRRSPLQAATSRDNIDIVEHLMAMQLDQLEIVTLLIDRGANVQLRNSSHASPLYLAMCLDRRKIMNYIFDRKAHSCLINYASQASLRDAIHGDILDILMLQTDGGSDICATSSCAKLLLHESIVGLHNQLDIVRYLIECGVDANTNDVDGLTPFTKTVMRNNLDNVSYLIDGGANVDAVYSTRRYPLHNATQYGSLDLIRLLIDKGACVNARDLNGATPLHYAVGRMKKTNSCVLITNLRGHFWTLDNNNESAVQETKRNNSMAVLNLLINSKADANANNNNGLSPLHEALSGVKNATLDACVLWPFLRCCRTDIKNIYGFLPVLVRRGCGIDSSKNEVTMLANRLIADGRYRDVLYLVLAGLYPDNKIVEDCLKQNLENIYRSDMSAITECVSKLTEVRSLQIMCRDKIRHRIWDVSSKSNIIPAIRTIAAIPGKIKAFLSCDELFTIWNADKDFQERNLENTSHSGMRLTPQCVNKLTGVRPFEIVCIEKIIHPIWHVSLASKIKPAIRRMTIIREKIKQFLPCDEHHTKWKLNDDECNRD